MAARSRSSTAVGCAAANAGLTAIAPRESGMPYLIGCQTVTLYPAALSWFGSLETNPVSAARPPARRGSTVGS